MKKNRHFIIGSISIVILAFYFSLPKYIQRAIIYQKVGIEDYKIFENRTVKAGNYIPWELSKNYNKIKLNDSTLKKIEKYKPIAFLVIQDKKIRYERYWDDFNQNSLSNSFSAAKSIVSLLIGIAIDEGKIDSLNQKVVDILPEFSKNPENKNLRIVDLLTMSSGLNWDENYGSLFSTTTKAYYGTDLWKQINNLKVTEQSGKKFKYLSCNPQLLGIILNKATGKTVSEYASEKIWQKIGAKNDALWSLDHKDGIEKAYCCFNSNARDFARFGQLILNNGRWDSTRVISENYIKQATKPATYLSDKNGKPVDFYGFQWWIMKYKNYNIPYARGILGQYIFVIPEKNAVVVRLGHKRDKRKKNHTPVDAYLYLKAAFDILE
ncbi:MAG: serine hydrolase [Bacteroidetes bacterium]|nr:MAG: serine hydrolase [Bacteroidota bacterium]